MKRILFFIPLLLIVFFASCIKDPAPNPEADILTFAYPSDSLRSETVITNNEVVVYPKMGVHLDDDEFTLTVTPGATYTIDKRNTGNEILCYVNVTSEDTESKKQYIIRQVRELPDIFSFETWVKVDKTKNYENPKDGDIYWASGNTGVAIIFSNKSAEEYPVRKTTAEKKSGNYAAEMRSLAGNIFNPCIAGSVFLGNFDATKVLSDKLKATQFGVTYTKGKPLALKGYYKYKQGTNGYMLSTNELDPDMDRLDSCDIYAILFKKDKNTEFLDGNNVKTSPNIIAKAQIQDRGNTEGDGLHPFTAYFVYQGYETPFNSQELKNNQYKIAIVCTSSTRGAFGEGRIGSSLIVDDIEIVTE